MQDIFIFGASGHARVIIDVVEEGNQYNILGLVDETDNRCESFRGYSIFNSVSVLCDQGIQAGLIAVGDNWQRLRISDSIRQKYPNFEFVTAIHPSANIGRGVSVGKGTVIMAGCTINSHARINCHTIINTGVNVDHDCIIDDFASLAPGVTLGGNVSVGLCTSIGLGTSVIQKIEIGQHTVVGAGSVVVKNLPSHVIAYGNPCRIVRNRAVSEPYL